MIYEGLDIGDIEFPENEPIDISEELEDNDSSFVTAEDEDLDEPIDNDSTPVKKSIEDLEDDDEEEDLNNSDDIEITPENNPINMLVGVLKETGIINVEDEELKENLDEDYLQNKIAETISKGKQEFIDNIENGDYKDVVDLINKGVPVAQAFQAIVQTSNYSDIDADSLDTEDFKQIIKDYLLAEDPDISEDEINDTIESYELANRIEAVGKKNLEKLQKNEEKQRLEIKAKVDEANALKVKQYDEFKNSYIEKVNSSKEIIPGIPVNDITKKTLIESKFKRDKDGKTKFNKVIESKPDLLTQIEYFVNVLEGDWSKLNASLKTKAVKELKSTVDSKEPVKKSTGGFDSRVMEKWLKRTTFNKNNLK